MLLNLTWLIPGLPIIASLVTTLLLVSFAKTMNRLTKPVSYFIIISIILSLLISFILYKEHVYGIYSVFGGIQILDHNLNLFVDSSALLFSLILGFSALLLMLISLISLERRNGYVRYFISLGFLSGSFLVFFFSGSIFHKFFDPLILVLDKIGVPFA